MSVVKDAREQLLTAVQALPEFAALTNTDFEASPIPTVTQLDEITQRKVSTFVADRKTEQVSRNCVATTVTTYITIQEPFAANDPALIEQANNELADATYALLGEQLGDWCIQSMEQVGVISPAYYNDHRTYMTPIKVEMRKSG